MRPLTRIAFLSLALLGLAGSALRAASVLLFHNDQSSSGVNSAETILTPAKLTTTTFSKRFSKLVDGNIYAQPLYVPGVVVTGGLQAGKHNLVFVATQHDSLYAFDADSGVIVWQDSFLATGIAGATSITSVPSNDVGTSDTSPEIGVCCTPVIDSATNLLYLTAKTKQIVNNATSTPNYVYTFYKIDITNGNATTNANIVASTVFGDTIYNGSSYTFRTNNSPTAAQDPFVVGTGDGVITVNGQNRVYFNVLRHMNRPGLILLNGVVYACFGSHGDQSPYHGWILGFDKNSLTVTTVCNLTPNGGLGGIWNSGGAPVVDSSGNIYLMVGNGTFDGSINAQNQVIGLNAQKMPANGNFGDCFVKLAVDSTTSVGSQGVNGYGLKVLDYFSPFNNQSLSSNDTDVGSGACILLPASAGNAAHRNLIVGAGKQGNIYLVDTAAMGEFNTTDQVVASEVAIGSSFDTPAFFNGTLYYAASSDTGKAFTISNASISSTAVATPDSFAFPGSTPSISANGTSNAIVWMLDHGSSQLRAYSGTNAASLSTEIWTSALASSSRDAPGSITKFATPTIADGHVFVGATTNFVTYGLSSVAPLLTSGAPASANAGVPYLFNFTATGAPYPTLSVTSGALPPGLSLSTGGSITGTPTTPGIYTGTVTATNSVSPVATQNFSITIYSTYSWWTSQEGLSGNNALQTAIVSPDGYDNLFKYALGLNPFTTYNPSDPALPLVQTKNVSGTNYLTLTFTFTGNATDVTYTVEASSDLAVWSTLYTHKGAPAPGTLTVQDNQPTSAAQMRFMRLLISP